MSKSYIALMHFPLDGSSWGVTFPDLPGCTSAGANFEEANANAKEALAGHVAALLADRDTVPEPRPFERLKADAAFAEDIADGAFAIPVELVDVPAPKERVNVMISPLILRLADDYARERRLSRSTLIELALAEYLQDDLGDKGLKLIEARGRRAQAEG